MSIKKTGSKLAHGVRQVKSQREQGEHKTSTKGGATTPAIKQAAKPIPASETAKPVAPRTVTENSLDILHPRRIWPD